VTPLARRVFLAGGLMPLLMLLPMAPWVDSQLEGRCMTLAGPLAVGLLLVPAGAEVLLLGAAALAALAGLAAALLDAYPVVPPAFSRETWLFRSFAFVDQGVMVAMWASAFAAQRDRPGLLAAAACTLTAALGLLLFVAVNFVLPEQGGWSVEVRLVASRTLGRPDAGPGLMLLTYVLLILAFASRPRGRGHGLGP
jgi:hypothetical protein